MRRVSSKTLIVMLVAITATLALARWRQGDPPMLARLSAFAFDSYQRLNPRQPTGQPIRIVAVDEASIGELGQWPWPRTTIAAMVDRLTEYGAAAIAFDVVFSEPDRTGPAALLRQLRERGFAGSEALAQALADLPDNDAVLAQAIKGGPVALGYFNAPDGPLPQVKAGFAQAGGDARPALARIGGSVASLPALQEAAAGNGSITLSDRPDDVVREIPLFLTDGAGLHAALSVEALRIAQGASTHVLRTSAGGGEVSGADTAITMFKTGEFEAPLTGDGRFLIHYARNDPALYLSAHLVLSGARDEIAPLVEGHIVFVGASARGLEDIRITPLGEEVPGVYMHAQVVDQILSAQFLSRPDWAKGAEIVAAALACVLVVLALPFLGPFRSALFGAGLTGLIGAGSWFAFARRGLLLDPLFPLAAVGAIYLSTTILLFAFAEREKRFVRQAFQRYLAPSLLSKLERDPGALRLGGETRPMTLMFMDIRGFTPISERLDPQQLVAFLNKLLSPLTEAIQAREGAIDKYIGDSIMAFWNAPLDVEDHPRKAALAALDMMRIVRELNAADAFGFHRPETGLGDVGIGIGLNTGLGCVGNMGSATRFDYSVVGDTVNVAARIESTTKPAGWPVLLSQTTAEACAGMALLRGGAMPLKGKSKPAILYALVGDEKLAGSDAWRRLAELHAEFLAAFDAGDANRAGELRDRCVAAATADLSAFYDALLASLESQVPGPRS